MSTSTISSTITDATGDPVVGARIVCRLVPAPAFRTSDGSEIDPVVETVTDSSGDWSLVLEETASISPSNTNYEVVEYLPSGPRKHTIQVGASDQSLFAALVTPPPAADGNTYLTQASADARYQALGGGFGSVGSVGTALSAGVSSAAARADHVHDLGNGSVDAAVLLADGILTQAKMATGWRALGVGTAAPSPIAQGDVWAHTNEKRLYVHDGSASVRVGHYTSAGRTGVRLRRAANQTMTNDTATAVSWDTEDADPDGFIAVTGSTLTVPAGLGGWYVAQVYATVVTSVSYTNLGGIFTVNSTEYHVPYYGVAVTPGVGVRLVFPWSGPLAAADTLSFKLLQSSTANRSFTFGLDLLRVGA